MTTRRSWSERSRRENFESSPSAQIVHESLLGSIRVAARANQWEPSVVAIVARVLRHEGVLTDAEAEWLEEAGPAWIEEDRPAT
jgi:hypothetical protein